MPDVITKSPSLHRRALPDELHVQRAVVVAGDDALRARLLHDRADGALRVGDQRHPGVVVEHLGDRADEAASLGDDDHPLRTPSRAAAVDRDERADVARVARDDGRGQERVVGELLADRIEVLRLLRPAPRPRARARGRWSGARSRRAARLFSSREPPASVMLFTQSATGRVVSRITACTGAVTLSVTFSTGSRSVRRLAAISTNAAIAMKPVQASVRAVISQRLLRGGSASAQRHVKTSLARPSVLTARLRSGVQSSGEYSRWPRGAMRSQRHRRNGVCYGCACSRVVTRARVARAAAPPRAAARPGPRPGSRARPSRCRAG